MYNLVCINGRWIFRSELFLWVSKNLHPVNVAWDDNKILLRSNAGPPDKGGNCAIHRGWEAKITTGILAQPSTEASTQQTNNLRMLFQKEI